MREITIGDAARSLAGHDKDMIYLIVGQSDGRFLMCNGREKRLSAPKKKNRKHIQPIFIENSSLKEALVAGNRITDEEIYRFLRSRFTDSAVGEVKNV